MSNIQRISLGRQLTPEEAAHHRALREAIEKEKPDINRRLLDEGYGPWGWEDRREFLDCIRALRAERERQGISQAELARQAKLTITDVEEIDAERQCNPRLTVLTRYAHALGYRLDLTLALRSPPPTSAVPVTTGSVPASITAGGT